MTDSVDKLSLMTVSEINIKEETETVVTINQSKTGAELECTEKGMDKENIIDENEKAETSNEKRISPIRYISSSKRRISAVRNVTVVEKNLKIIVNEKRNVPLYEYNFLRSRESRSRSRSILRYKRRRIDDRSRSRETKYHRYLSNGRKENSVEISDRNIERHEGEMDSNYRRNKCRDRIIRSRRSYQNRNRRGDSGSRSGDRVTRSHRSRSRSYYSRNHSRNSRSRTRNRISRSRRSRSPSYHSRNRSRNSRSGRSGRYIYSRYERRSRSSEKYRPDFYQRFLQIYRNHIKNSALRL